jgi:hypothetical protein
MFHIRLMSLRSQVYHANQTSPKTFANEMDRCVFLQGNGVAHALAQLANHSHNFDVWLEDIPPNIVSALRIDSFS